MVSSTLPAFDDDLWELYGPDDWTQAHNIADQNPQMLRELQRQFLIEATKYNAIPLDDRRIERFNADLAGRPVLIKGKAQSLYAGARRLPENCVLNIKNKSYAVTAEVDVSADGAQGVIVAQGGAFGGWSFYTHDGRLKYCYNLFGIQLFTTESNTVLAEGRRQVRMEFAYAGGGLGKGGGVTLYIDGQPVGQGAVSGTIPMVFSADETLDVGADTGTLVSPEYRGCAEFNGRIHWVQIDLGTDDHDHLISAEERLAVVMARQ
jgi:arylsulfatase